MGYKSTLLLTQSPPKPVLVTNYSKAPTFVMLGADSVEACPSGRRLCLPVARLRLGRRESLPQKRRLSGSATVYYSSGKEDITLTYNVHCAILRVKSNTI